MATSRYLNKHDVEISNSLMNCRVFWARAVSSENQSLLTQYTRHTFYEIQYALEGHIGMVVDEGQELYVAESDFVVIPPDTYHQVVDAESAGARFIMAFSVETKDEGFGRLLKNLDSLVPHKETPNMRGLLSLMADKNEDCGIMKEASLSTLLECFLFEIIEAVTPSKSALFYSEKNKPSQTGIALEIIKKHSGINIKVSDLAKELNMSERHLCRIFTNELGISPKEAINHEKLKKIEEYITHTRLSLREISELCGFCDEYAMNKFFKRQTKTTLSDFAKLAKK